MGSVLKKNPAVELRIPDGLSRAFWSDESFLMGPNFNLTQLLNETLSLSLSPFLMVDCRHDLLVSLLYPKADLATGFFGVGPLVALAHLFRTQGHGKIELDSSTKLLGHLNEYFECPQVKLVETGGELEQALVVDQPDLISEVWKRIKQGGTLIAASFSMKAPEFPAKEFEALGILWPIGESTEFGWQFSGKEGWDLDQLSYWKIKKI
jgi:hypothetical protein